MSWRTRDARAFADALEGRAASNAAQLDALIAVAQRLRAATADLRPSSTFQASLRTTLMAEAATVLIAGAPPIPTHTHRRPVSSATRRGAAIVAALLATAFGLVGMTAASASALPGDTLYPVKRGIESTQLALKRGDSDRGAFRLELAGERLQETTVLAQRRSVPSAVEAETLTEYSEQAGRGSDALVRSFKANNRRAEIIAINRFANTAAVGLQKLEDKLYGPSAAVLVSAQSQLGAIVETAARLCPACGGIDPDVLSALTGTGPGTKSPSPPSPPSPPEPPAPAPPADSGPALAPAPIGRPADSGPSEDEDEEEDEETASDSDDLSDSDDATPTPSPSPSPSPSASPSPSPSPSPTPSAPTADFTWSGRPGVGNELRVDFRDASSPDATTWRWDFGDGSPTSQVKNPPRHTYPAPGTYAVTLTVSNTAGRTDSVTKRVTVPVR